jgi:hypothetical protein
MDWIHLAQDLDKLWALVNTVMISIKFPWLPIRGSASFSRKTTHHGVSHLDVTEQWLRNLGNGVFCVLVTDGGIFEYVCEVPSVVSMNDGTVIAFNCTPKTL